MSNVNPLDRHGSLYGLAQAARDGDDIAEESGIEAAVSDLGLSFEDTRYVAEQRALRAVLIFGGRADELQTLNEGDFRAVELTERERDQMKLLTAAYLDGICLGVRYGQRRAAPFGLGDALRLPR
jgi:hypothetical protein